ncbi:SWIM zinc finger family protein [Nitrosococcus wardiae]|uniref:SWIM-type domain-containing protein n=1 Tax=Nitrosococcus wardiae TaxID=1814290 RepID=A0A4P7BZJ9_9GAMM|nr:SWIM zinc finger family protein [Nitrosococcus wardiae]QBQ55658.1 hypothetical protein E3U44_14910 [Nitrosococcus wardiae]
MAKISRTWWGQRFLEALERCTDPGRLSRGRSYSSPRRLLSFSLEGATIKAKIRGNVNPYFGVYKEPRYQVEIQLRSIPSKAWTGIIQRLGSNAGWLSRLLLNEMPDDIEEAFAASQQTLLPGSEKDLKTDCTCPDWANPCKHVAGVYYHVAHLLDHDPFLLFQLRGLSKEKLQQKLAKTPLGQALANELLPQEELTPEGVSHRYPQPNLHPVEKNLTYKAFWSGHSLPDRSGHPQEAPREGAPRPSSGVPALLIKKQGDYPPFWERDNSFIEAMEHIYQQVQAKNKESL